VYLAARGDSGRGEWISRAELRSLFWPEADENTAQNNLRQLLMRVRALGWATGLEVETERLRFTPLTDLKHFKEALEHHRWAEAVRLYNGEFCQGFGVRETAPYQDWLASEREHLRGLWYRASLERAAELEARGEFEMATHLLEQVLETDPLEEDTMTAWMRLTARSGHRARTLERYERFRAALQHELGLEPLEVMRSLADAIRRGDMIENASITSGSPLAQPSPVSSIGPVNSIGPVSSISPETRPHSDVLIGREDEWARLEVAWNTTKIIAITGEAGIGKTRLMMEFAASRGRYRLIEGRPGDATIPFVTITRYLRDLFHARPDLRVPDWIRAGLAQLVPEKPRTPSDEPDVHLDLFEAIIELVLHDQPNVTALLGDDLHRFDHASLELVSRGVKRFLEQQTPEQHGKTLHLIATLAPDELPPEFQTALHDLVDAGQISLVHLGPLQPDATKALVAALAPEATPLADALHRYTGGHPGFIVQTLEALIRQNMLAQAIRLGRLPDGFVSPTQTVAAIRHRLERLSSAALQMLRLAAFAPEDFRPDLTALVLDLAPLEQAVLLEELERADLIHPHRFTSELVPEVVRAATPPTVQTLLHHRIAIALGQLGADPQRIAAHQMAVYSETR
jgi:DNA-binding SARP family transcriptional activator